MGTNTNTGSANAQFSPTAAGANASPIADSASPAAGTASSENPSPRQSSTNLPAVPTDGSLVLPGPSPSASVLPGVAAVSTSTNPRAGPIVAGVLVPVLLLLLGTAAWLAWRRRRRVRDKREWERTHAEIAEAVRGVGGRARVSLLPSAWTRFEGKTEA